MSTMTPEQYINMIAQSGLTVLPSNVLSDATVSSTTPLMRDNNDAPNPFEALGLAQTPETSTPQITSALNTPTLG